MPRIKVCGQMGVKHLGGPRLVGRHAWVCLEICGAGRSCYNDQMYGSEMGKRSGLAHAVWGEAE